MVVEDSPTERAFMGAMLKKSGFDVVMVSDGAAAIERAKLDRPDAILMDVVMPGLNGFQATRIITHDDATRHIPVIMCTNKNQDTDKVWALRQGAVGYLTKPLKESELLAEIGLRTASRRAHEQESNVRPAP
jgi:twitching motility two-component system response regulator PilH